MDKKYEGRTMTETKRYCATLAIKKDIYVSAKNRTEARKKIKEKLSKQKGANFVHIDYLDETFMWG